MAEPVHKGAWLEPPADLVDGDLALWRDVCDQLEELGVLRRADSGAVERYVRTAGLVRRIRAEWIEDGGKATTRGGATGRAIVSHPLVSMLANAERDASRYAGELLLTPAARMRQGFRDDQPTLPGMGDLDLGARVEQVDR